MHVLLGIHLVDVFWFNATHLVMARTPTWKRWTILMCGLMENLVFSGSILGWSALNHMLKQEGIFESVCYSSPEVELSSLDNYSYGVNSSVNSYTVTSRSAVGGCPSQDRLLNLAYTLGTFFNGFTAFIWGFLLDRWGLRIVRLIINAFLFLGSLLLSFTSKDTSFLTFPAIILLCLGGVPIRIANMQFANLFPKNRSTVITFYSGAFSASAVIFVLLKYGYDFGFSFRWTCFTLVVLSLAMIPVTFLLLPIQAVREEEDDDGGSNDSKLILNKKYHAKNNLALVSSTITLEKFKVISSPIPIKRIVDSGITGVTQITGQVNYGNTVDGTNEETICKSISTINSNLEQLQDNEPLPPRPPSSSSKSSSSTASAASSTDQVPLKQSLFSLPFSLHQWWYSWLITYMIMYVGSMNLWLDRVTTDIEVASNFSKIFGIIQILCLVIAPIAGLIMDHQVNKANLEVDPFKKQLARIQAGFWPMMFTTSTLTAILVCRFFNSPIAIYTSIIFITLLRSFLVAVASAYLRIRFPASHFNKLLGIMSTCGAFVTLLQFPLFVWEAQDPTNALWVNLFNCLCTLIAYLNPIHLMITPLQEKLLKEDMLKEVQRKSKQALH